VKAIFYALFSLAALVLVLPAAAQEASEARNETLILYVAPDTVDCVGVTPQTCLQIRFSPEAEWQRHFENIRSFEHIPGFNYTLLVEKIQRNPVAADRSSFFYQLVSILQTTPVAEDEGFYNLYTPGGEYFVAHIAAETQTCRDGFTPEIDCLQLTIGGQESVLINPARITNFAYVRGSEYLLVVEREDLNTDRVADVPPFIYRLVQIASETLIEA